MRERIESDSDIKDRIRYEIVETDLCDLHKSEEILEPRIREKGRVDILVNVAGGFISKPFVETEAEDFYPICSPFLSPVGRFFLLCLTSVSVP